jgi:hypothetical protein
VGGSHRTVLGGSLAGGRERWIAAFVAMHHRRPTPIRGSTGIEYRHVNLKALIARRLIGHGSSVSLGIVTCPPLCGRVTARADHGGTRVARGTTLAREGTRAGCG